jgi:hypothetical protein
LAELDVWRVMRGSGAELARGFPVAVFFRAGGMEVDG